MLQPSEDGSTAKVVVVYDTAKRRYFLPRGRKDIGETLEQAGFREGYEARTTMVAMTQVTDDRLGERIQAPTITFVPPSQATSHP